MRPALAPRLYWQEPKKRRDAGKLRLGVNHGDSVRIPCENGRFTLNMPRNSGGKGVFSPMVGNDSLSSLRVHAGVVVAVTFHKVDTAPHPQTGADGRGEGGEGGNTGSEKAHDMVNRKRTEQQNLEVYLKLRTP